MSCYTFNGKTLTEEELFNRIKTELLSNPELSKIASIVYKLDLPKQVLQNIKDAGEIAQAELDAAVRNSKPLPYIGANKFAVARQELTKRRLTPEYLPESRESNYIENHKNEFEGSEQEKIEAAKKAFIDQTNEESHNSTIGTMLHDMIHFLLTEKKGTESVEFKQLISKIKEELKKVDESDGIPIAVTVTKKVKQFADVAENEKLEERADYIAAILTNNAISVIEEVHKLYGTDVTMFSEMPMVLKRQLSCSNENEPYKHYDGILGIADLIILDKNNKVHILDYKVCTRPYKDWYAAKLNEVEYQLAIYRAMLTEAGFSGNDIDMTIVPILMEKNNISSMDLQDFVKEGQGTWRGSSRIDWENGTFTKELRRFGIGQCLTVMDSVVTDLSAAIEEDRLKLFGDYEEPKHASKQWYIDNKLEKFKEKGKVKYRFWSQFEGTKGGEYIVDDYDEFVKDGGHIDQYILQVTKSRNDIAKRIVEDINRLKEAINAGKKLDDEEFLGAKGERAVMLKGVLGRYLSSEWRLVDMPAELLDKGILLFAKPDTTKEDGTEIIEVVTLADSELNQIIPINGNTSLLGKFYDDEAVKNLSIKPMKAYYKHIKAMEAITILNALLLKKPDMFDKAYLGNLIVLNPASIQYEENEGTCVKQLIDNFNLLASKNNGDVENLIKNVQTPEPFEYAMSEVMRILSPLEPDEKLKKLISSVQEDGTSLRAKRKVVQRMLELLEENYPELQNFGLGGDGKFNLNSDVQKIYVILSQILNLLYGKNVEFNGEMPKVGASLHELISMLGLPFTGRQIQTDDTGTNIVGIGNGLDWTTPNASRSLLVKQIQSYYSVMYSNVRKEFNTETAFVTNLTKQYISDLGPTFSLLDSSHIKVWKRLLKKDGDKIDSRLILKNPYDSSEDLTEIDREFLKQYLWEINKYFLPESSVIDRSIHYKDHEREIESSEFFMDRMADGTYLQLPLTKASGWQRLTHLPDQGIKNFFTEMWNDFEETYSPMVVHPAFRKQHSDKQPTEVINFYDISPAKRRQLIEEMKDPSAFSFDLDFIACDVAFLTIKKQHYEEGLRLTNSMIVAAQFIAQTTGAEMQPEIETTKEFAKVLQGESLLSKDAEKIAKPMSVARKLNSLALLAFRPLSFFKELTFGLFVNHSRALASKIRGGFNQISQVNIAKASSIVFGQRAAKLGKSAVGMGSLADFTLCELINRRYGIANQDMHRMAENASMSRTGWINNASKFMYIAQSAPDYYNRMTLMIAKMMEDGSFDAHSLDENGVLHYDWHKDKRFSELHKHGLNSDYKSEAYNKQKSLYIAMCEEFRDAGEDDLITYDPKTKKIVYGEITDAYTPRQKDAIKEIADMAYGYYDSESKALVHHKFLGLLYLQFQTFISSKYNEWFRGSAPKGTNTAQGDFVPLVVDGVKYYVKHDISEDGKYLGTRRVPETELTEEEKASLPEATVWQGDFSEGIVYSLLYTIRDICTFNWKSAFTNRQRLANLYLGTYEILIGMILAELLKVFLGGEGATTKDLSPWARTVYRGMQDVGPQAMGQISITPSFINTWSNVKTDAIKLLSGSEGAYKSIMLHFGATRDFIWEDER